MRRWRRLVIIVAAVVAVALAGAAATWFVVLPHWRPPLEDGEMYGVDVSAHQETIDWDQVAGDDIEFAYIKASEGQGWVDDRFRENWRDSADVGIERGAYHFFTLCAPGAAQAENFLRVAPPEPDALAPAIDLELTGNCSERPPAAQVAQEIDTFVHRVEQAWGRELLFYVRPGWNELYPIRDGLDRPLWELRRLRRPDDDRWRVWQIHAYADVDGISGGVDLDVMRTG